MIKNFQQFFESIKTDKLSELKNHLNRSNIDLAKWIIDNLNIEHKGELTDDVAVKIIKSVDSKEYWSKLPTMYFFDSPAETVKPNSWLMHFTKHPLEIESSGFKKGEPDYLKLGMTWGKNSNSPGYNYALLPEDALETYSTLDKAFVHWVSNLQNKGGVVFFKAPAIKAWHFGDEIEQAIFWGPDAINIIAAFRENGKWKYKNKVYDTLEEVYDEIS